MTNNHQKKIGVMPIGILLTTLLTAWLGWTLFNGDKQLFTSGPTSFGHYQIEIACKTCHGEPFSGKDVMQKACESCHLQALKKVDDSHPRSVFTDPANHDLIDKLNATYCVTCHREHKPEITRQFGVTLAKDFCVECHQDIAQERPSHQDFAFDSCSNAGCHNYHDNSMLYQKFLRKHLDESSLKTKAKMPPKNALKKWQKKKKNKLQTAEQINLLVRSVQSGRYQLIGTLDNSRDHTATVAKRWAQSIHAKTGTDCDHCHQQPIKTANDQIQICKSCHKKTVAGFVSGHHGMKLSIADNTIRPIDAQSPMKQTANKRPQCGSCHDPHLPNLQQAAVESCLKCHNSAHVKSYKQSKHYQLWMQSLQNNEPDRGVSCATCHLPRIKKGKWVTVEHNQNANLRPPIKMLRRVCMQCHGLDFSLAALSDSRLRHKNFIGQPAQPHPTIQLLREANTRPSEKTHDLKNQPRSKL